jgi:hypothetical protein
MYHMRRANLTLERESAGVCCCVVIWTLFGEVRFDYRQDLVRYKRGNFRPTEMDTVLFMLVKSSNKLEIL